MELILRKDLHIHAYIGEVINGKFQSIFSIDRDNNKYHIVKRRVELDPSKYRRYAFDLPIGVCKDIELYTKLTNDAINRTRMFIQSSRWTKFDKHLLRKYDYALIVQESDYTHMIRYYTFINNMYNKSIMIIEDGDNFNLKNLHSMPESGKLIQLDETKFHALLQNMDIEWWMNYSRLTNSIITMIEIVSGINFIDCDLLID